MANEVYTDWPSGENVYYIVRLKGGTVWYPAGQAFEGWGDSSHTRDDYDIPLTDRGGDFYEADFDTNIPAGRYTVQVFIRHGAAPASTDTLRSSADFRWSGAGRVGGGTVIGSGVGISAGGVLTFVNRRLRRSETNIDTELQSVLDDLSQGPYIAGVDESQSISDDEEYLAKPDEYFSMISIVLNDGTSDRPPLKPFPGGYKAYKKERGNVSSVYTSHPIYYVVWGDYIWLYPIPGQTYTARIDYHKVHAQDVDTIEFSDEWRRAINFGTTFEVAATYKLPDQIAMWSQRYEAEKERQRLAHPGVPRIVGT